MLGRVASTTRLFADDSLLYREIRTIEDTDIMQEEMRKLEQWKREYAVQPLNM
ncbi:hypothetical protein DPMN_022515 [Dreissena polymorpha]|uniref:Uncharacterized protein n=1 Tax=Dreissena polymorpha TaxID=45954 RepID=A0A9D4SAV4_DREPO|nr:hypothetical protein DPMN_022515 [Dreissena polymorpha]